MRAYILRCVKGDSKCSQIFTPTRDEYTLHSMHKMSLYNTTFFSILSYIFPPIYPGRRKHKLEKATRGTDILYFQRCRS
ncbi:predicted protein [Botrytis cinerea T4]|uniref:Uncharacterized protein n=1 Tax=Botryotinia fuckeliana (strain T4) TaxID=999810 RepID=G2Y4D7_BOTF4|nr:predicted protein [Botrytis cinerea T4]